jgi:hypothetical protein
MFKIGDRLVADDYHKEEFGVEFVTITSINLKNKVYHWECPGYLGGKVHSGYFFHQAVKWIPKDEIRDNKLNDLGI